MLCLQGASAPEVRFSSGYHFSAPLQAADCCLTPPPPRFPQSAAVYKSFHREAPKRQVYSSWRPPLWRTPNPAIYAAVTNFPQQNPSIYESVNVECPIWGVSASAPQHLVVLYLTRTRAGGTFILTSFGEAPDSLATPPTRTPQPAPRSPPCGGPETGPN